MYAAEFGFVILAIAVTAVRFMILLPRNEKQDDIAA
jgi:hypothetical protein